MSTSTKTKASIRQGGPGSSHQNAKEPPDIEKPTAEDPMRRRSFVSGGGGERDRHHAHRPEDKSGSSRSASKGKS
jgi:hypothetical protein